MDAGTVRLVVYVAALILPVVVSVIVTAKMTAERCNENKDRIDNIERSIKERLYHQNGTLVYITEPQCEKNQMGCQKFLVERLDSMEKTMTDALIRGMKKREQNEAKIDEIGKVVVRVENFMNFLHDAGMGKVPKA